jgi:hypothetical protein
MTIPSGGKRIALTGSAATSNLVLNKSAWGKFPHFFTYLLRKYPVPHHFLLTLLFLWDATVGSSDSPIGQISLSQIPVRNRERNKWLAAFVAVGFWEVVKAKPSDGGKSGSMYVYNESTTPEAWETFFMAASRAQHFPGWDDVSTEQFAQMFIRAMGKITEAKPNR